MRLLYYHACHNVQLVNICLKKQIDWGNTKQRNANIFILGYYNYFEAGKTFLEIKECQKKKKKEIKECKPLIFWGKSAK